MTDKTVSRIPAATRATMADQLDSIIREVQVLQGVLRASQPDMSLATASTALIGAKISLTEVIDAMGHVESEAAAESTPVVAAFETDEGIVYFEV